MPEQLTHEQLVARLKGSFAFPIAGHMIPPTGLHDKPRWREGHPGLSNYLWMVGQALAGGASLPTAVAQDGRLDHDPNAAAAHAIRVADAVFEQLAMKFTAQNDAGVQS
jgi:hypothetical protein